MREMFSVEKYFFKVCNNEGGKKAAKDFVKKI